MEEATTREIDAYARFLARKEVRQRWLEQGRKHYDHSQKELSEAANELLRSRPELIGLARIAVEGEAFKSKGNFCAEITVEMVEARMIVVGYARVSTDGQTLDAQHAALKAAGAEKVFAEKVSGAQTDRKQPVGHKT